MLFTLGAGAAALALSGCSAVHDREIPLKNSSTRGTPVVTRLSASSSSFRFFWLGGEPSLKQAVDRLYANAAGAGYQIAGNNYAFQNMLAEEKDAFLYPFLGTGTLTVTADLYAYENYPCDEQQETKDSN